jgi:hypothetical protein
MGQYISHSRDTLGKTHSPLSTDHTSVLVPCVRRAIRLEQAVPMAPKSFHRLYSFSPTVVAACYNGR